VTLLEETVEALWVLPAGPARLHVVPPDGCSDLVFSRRDDGTVETVLVGPSTALSEVPVSAGEVFAGVRFRPWVLAPTLGLQAHALRNQGTPLAHLCPELAHRFARLSPKNLLGALEAQAATLVTPLSREQRLVRDATGLLEDPETSVSAVAKALHVGERTLRRAFLSTVGLGPAALTRFRRLQRALAALQRGEAPADLAARLGFADQPHLHRDVRAFTGLPPSAQRTIGRSLQEWRPGP
jgi:AraC-like DNA-binding protein